MTSTAITFSEGLDGQDDHLDDLLSLWEQAQVSCMEPASSPQTDLISFAQDAAYFSVVDIKHGAPSNDGTPSSESESDGFTSGNPGPSQPPRMEPLSPRQAEETQRLIEELFDIVRDRQSRGSSQARTPSEPEELPKGIAGFVYLVSAGGDEPRHILNIGLSAHRVQAHVLGGLGETEVQAALALFGKLLVRCWSTLQTDSSAWYSWQLFRGFSNEGTRRMAFWIALQSQWRDVTTMAMLDTEWVIRQISQRASWSTPTGLWGALYEKHAKEREDLQRWVQSFGTYRPSMPRALSAETVRNMINDAVLSSASESESEVFRALEICVAMGHGAPPCAEEQGVDYVYSSQGHVDEI
ncbi:uncharacterized protein SCHCODRAFT_02513146 [Schizophyllum commune H4-8]|nr:uncharacterized protein SCHCODRAFT_02513146 [Schizophyllum commune H4-8]KAI5888676.1 hypothetical protein SCHCODRAFT_02513146 [Schizophyllum commune H4-8]